MKLLISKNISFLILFILVSVNLGAQNNREVFSIVVDKTAKPVENFRGFGAEWDSRAYNENGVTAKDFQLIGERIKWMKTPIVRMMMQTKWCYSESLGYNWNNENMNSLYRHLNFCQQNEIDVMLTDWGVEVDWLAVDGISSTDDEKYAEVISTYVDYLINTKGYSCIKYFVLVNEPNYEVGNFERWKTGLENVYNAFIDKGLNKKIKIAAPGQSNNKEWFFDTVDEIRFAVDVYDTHLYAWKDKTIFGGVHSELKELWDYAESIDVNVDRKLYFVSEAGMRDGQSAAISTQIDSFYYGVFMIDFAIQAILAGSNSVLAWMMDDNSHPDFNWGLWKNKKNNLELRPWFYTWGLLTKLFPANAEVFKIRPRSIKLRALAAKVKSNGNYFWSFVLVNVDTKPVKIKLMADDDYEKTFYNFEYSDNKYKTNSNGYPSPNSSFKMNLNENREFILPPSSVTFITSVNVN